MGGLKRRWGNLKIFLGCLITLEEPKEILCKLKEPWTEGSLEARGWKGVECPKMCWGSLEGPLKVQKCFEV